MVQPDDQAKFTYNDVDECRQRIIEACRKKDPNVAEAMSRMARRLERMFSSEDGEKETAGS